MPSDVIYLDNHATTRCDPRVVEAMLPWLTEEYGNAGSVGHAFGDAARDAVEQSRESIARSVGAEPAEIVFTSGATESNNLALRGLFDHARRKRDGLVSVETEHRAVLDPIARLAKRGARVTLLGVERRGSIRAGWLDPDRVADALDDQTLLVSVMLANNEVGAIQPIREIAALCRERGVMIHCDATQGVGKIPTDAGVMGVDLMSFSAHKFYGPKGVGALYVRQGSPIVRLEPSAIGGGQERGRRSGTLNVPGVVGMARALELCNELGDEEAIRLAALRDHLFGLLQRGIPNLELLGPGLDPTRRLPHNLNVHLPGIDGETLRMRAPGVAMSTGAACSSTDPEPSHVLRALGLTGDEARCSLRLGLGRFTTADEIELAAERIVRAADDLRGLTADLGDGAVG